MNSACFNVDFVLILLPTFRDDPRAVRLTMEAFVDRKDLEISTAIKVASFGFARKVQVSRLRTNNLTTKK